MFNRINYVMNIRALSFLWTTIMAMLFLVSCKGGSERQEVALEEGDEYLNPMDSVVRNTVTYNRLGEVYGYLTRHPEFVHSSDSVGYGRSGAGNDDSTMLWKDCEGLRVYTIPEDSHRASYHLNFIQFRNGEGRIDSTLLEDNAGGVVGFVSLKGRDGKIYFLVKTDLYYGHQGTAKCERICAFSIQGNRLVKEKLFHARGRQYDDIEVCCGGHRYFPLDFRETVLIGMNDYRFEGGDPVLVITEVNDADWPTGNGLRYEWKGDCFEYTGKCSYDANGIL